MSAVAKNKLELILTRISIGNPHRSSSIRPYYRTRAGILHRWIARDRLVAGKIFACYLHFTAPENRTRRHTLAKGSGNFRGLPFFSRRTQKYRSGVSVNSSYKQHIYMYMYMYNRIRPYGINRILSYYFLFWFSCYFVYTRWSRICFNKYLFGNMYSQEREVSSWIFVVLSLCPLSIGIDRIVSLLLVTFGLKRVVLYYRYVVNPIYDIDH